MDTELDDFKREIDLRQYAAGMGYELDKRESWRGSAVMRRGGDKIVIKRDKDGHYVYFSVRDDHDRDHHRLHPSPRALKPRRDAQGIALVARPAATRAAPRFCTAGDHRQGPNAGR